VRTHVQLVQLFSSFLNRFATPLDLRAERKAGEDPPTIQAKDLPIRSKAAVLRRPNLFRQKSSTSGDGARSVAPTPKTNRAAKFGRRVSSADCFAANYVLRYPAS
jgi:hypothetical protein